MLARGEEMRPKAVPHLRRFAGHEEAKIRAAAIRGLVRAAPTSMDQELAAALRDDDSKVRVAGAEALMVLFDEARDDARRRIEQRQEQIAHLGRPDGIGVHPFGPPQPSRMGRLGNALKSLFGPEGDEPVEPVESPGGQTAPEHAAAEDTPLEPAAETPGTTGETPEPAEETTPDPAAGQAPPGQPPTGGPPDAEATDQQATDQAEPLDGPQPPATRPDHGGRQPGTTPAAVALADPGPEWDQWLEDFCEGKGRPEMADAMVEPLRAMLAAEDARERLAAARALVPLGRADEALPVLLEVARSEPGLVGDATDVLPWLVWQRRLEVFRELRGLVEEDDTYRLIQGLVPVADHRAAEVAWNLLGDEEQARPMVGALNQILLRIYFGSRYYGSPEQFGPVIRRAALRAVRPRAKEGVLWQRVVALLLLLKVAPGEAAAIAGPLADDDSAKPTLRRAAFHIYLAGLPAAARRKAAIAALEHGDPSRVRLALAFLAEGQRPLSRLQLEDVEQRVGVPVNALDHVVSAPHGAGPIVPQAPRGLKPQHVRPLIDRDDPAVAARAGYLLALLGDEQGLKPLLRLWREETEGKPGSQVRHDLGELDAMVYRAIAILNDSSKIDVLRKIYKSLDEYEVSQFYWTIRIMSGAEVLRLRSEIRDEVGMEQLR